MKIFSGFDAIKFPEENLIFITHNEYLYYIYNPESNYWRRHGNAGNDHLTISNYPDVSVEELTAAMGGKFPTTEKDFMRLCRPSCLCIRDMLDLMDEDYPKYMSVWNIRNAVHRFLLESDITFKSYLKVKELFDRATSLKTDNSQLLSQIHELSFSILGRDIYKKEIGIVDGHDSSSYFWIQPVRIIDNENTDDLDNVAEMSSAEISIEEDDVAQYLTPFLYKFFDSNLEANANRRDADDFEWYLTHNFFTYESVESILKDISDTIDALSTGRENEYTAKLKIKRGTSTYTLLYAKNLNEEQIKEYNDNRPKEDNTEADLVIDFYRRFIYRMEYMLKVGREKGYNLISFMGP